MSDVLKRNLESLKKHQPYVYKKLMLYTDGKYKPENNNVNRILLARDGDLIFNMLVICGEREYLLCDHEDPITQSYRWIDKYIDPTNKAEIVFGMGFGFHIEVLLASFENKRVVVVEPNIELFYQVLSVRNMEFIISKSEIYVDEDVNAVLSRLHALLWDTQKGGIQCQPFEVYAEIFEEDWEKLRNNFIKHVQNFTVDIATRRYFAELWIYNYIKNARKLSAASNADGLVGKFKGIPGILVSAGPSLSKNIELVKQLKDRCVIMAAGTAVNILEKNGITPHFMVGIDAGEAEARIHEKVKSKDIYFLYSNQIATGSVDSYEGPKFFMNYNVDVFTAEFLKFSDIKSEMFISGPTVSNTCADLLFKMGCNPIILVGQDLSYTSGSRHAGDAEGSFLKADVDHSKEGFTLAKDIYGNDVYTRPGFLSMKNWFEGYFEMVKDRVEIINATEGGLNIEFARNDTLKNVIDSYGFKPEIIEERIHSIYEECKFNEEVNEKFNNYLEDINAEIEKLEEYSRKQLKLVDLINRDVYHPASNKKAFDRKVFEVNELTERVTGSKIFKSILSGLVDIEFYLIKMEVDRATEGMTSYSEVKDIYINAIKKQNSILTDKLNKVKAIL